MPVAAGLIIKGMCDCNPIVAGKYSPCDYFTEGFVDTGIIDMIASKNYSTDEVQKNEIQCRICGSARRHWQFVLYVL